MRKTLQVEGTVHMTSASSSICLTGADDLLIAESSGTLPATLAQARQLIRRLGPVLRFSGLTLEVRRSGRPVARIGRQARPSWLARLAGFAGTELCWRGLLRWRG